MAARQAFALLALLMALAGCGGMKPEQFAKAEPKLKVEEYFLGRTRGWGIFEDRFGDLRRHDYESWVEQEGPRPSRRPLRERRAAARRAETWRADTPYRDASGGILTLPTLLDLCGLEIPSTVRGCACSC